MGSFGPGASHAGSRYFVVTDDLIEKCQQDYVAGRDLGQAVFHLNADEVTIIAVESLEADQVMRSLPQVIGKPLPSEMGDWALACLAELLLQGAVDARQMRRISEVVPDAMRHDAWDILERVLDSPTACPMLWYQDIYFDVAQDYRMKKDLRAIDLVKRGLAYDLRYQEGGNADNRLRDLAECYLWLDHPDRGLALFAQLLHNDPGDVWTYNAMAFTLGRVGLAELGLEAARRGLALVEATDDPDKLHDQLLDAVDELEMGERRGRETQADPSVLAGVRAALDLDFDAGWHKPATDLCQELIPDLDRVPVKRKLTVSDLNYTPARCPQPSQTARNLGRNDPCWCGSGAKYKHCHWRQDRRTR